MVASRGAPQPREEDRSEAGLPSKGRPHLNLLRISLRSVQALVAQQAGSGAWWSELRMRPALGAVRNSLATCPAVHRCQVVRPSRTPAKVCANPHLEARLQQGRAGQALR